MITKVIKIGNSRGIRIPKSIIEQSHLTNEVELEIKNGNILIKALNKKRENWDSAFNLMSVNKDDILLDSENLDKQNSWDDNEWVW
jgi:antitoxin MazE